MRTLITGGAGFIGSHLSERFLREGHEVLVSRPEVIYRNDENGNLLEPIEKLFLEIPKEFMGVVLENLSGRKAEIVNMHHHGWPPWCAANMAGGPDSGFSVTRPRGP